ncbi:UNKNOWN [Stylonychia lemnae]|uniref:Uncharacterized protein n=1 Tax=Stylonychia lemnae TaxID=5949 RepID=A0A078A530_STYLE|nr:UNKNOWN [Stylonychia lemnae]|eukprot:CDW76974.1 UNKNOWN [Stylonychia lemnae]
MLEQEVQEINSLVNLENQNPELNAKILGKTLFHEKQKELFEKRLQVSIRDDQKIFAATQLPFLSAILFEELKSEGRNNSQKPLQDWKLVALIFGFQVGVEIGQYYKGEISGKMLARRIAINSIQMGANAIFFNQGAEKCAKGCQFIFLEAGKHLNAPLSTVCPMLGTWVGEYIGLFAAVYGSIIVRCLTGLLADLVCDTYSDVEFIHKNKINERYQS